MKPLLKLSQVRRLSGQGEHYDSAAPRLGEVRPVELAVDDLRVAPVDLQHVPVDRPVGGPAHVAHQLEQLGAERGDAGMNSSVVPGWSPTTEQSARISSRLAWRDGTESPWRSL